MCIIVYKTATANFPNKKTLRKCFENNDDGAGYMFAYNNAVHIRKGFMTFKDFWNDLRSIRKKYGENIPYVMHFRISTQAGVNPTICHPYPVSDTMNDLRQLRSLTPVGIAHNGIIDITSQSCNKTIDYNDTMAFIMRYASVIIDRDVRWYNNAKNIKILETLIGTANKLAILSADGHCELIGNFVKEGGVYYSNYSYFQNYYTAIAAQYSNYKYLTDDDEWEVFYDAENDQYDFSDDYCPYIFDGMTTYCTKCKQYAYCHDFIQC